jgi:glutamate-1-semialdehyde 2,1-aminomutase
MAVEERLKLGTSYGAPTELELEMARLIIEMVPSIEMVRMVNSGTEATMSAIRLARGYTGRNKIVKFEGCYHGHGDSLLVSAGSGMATLSIPACPGIPDEIAEDTISIPFNDIGVLRDVFSKHGSDIACVIVEPVPANMGVVLPEEGFLEAIRELTIRYGSLLIFDEVITGFRLAPGGAQELYEILPDITCLGKIIGGGLPVGAYGGKREIMEHMAPVGDIYQAGTLSGNPLAMTAGIVTLQILRNKESYKDLQEKGDFLFNELKESARSAGIDLTINYHGSLGSIFFTPGPVKDFNSAKASDSGLFKKFYHNMLSKGIYLAPSPFEAIFISIAHDNESLEYTAESARKSFKEL